MKRSRFSEEQIIEILKEQAAGVSVADLCRKHGVSHPYIYRWKAKFGGMEVSEAKRLKLLEDENTRLKRLWPTRCWTMRVEPGGRCQPSPAHASDRPGAPPLRLSTPARAAQARRLLGQPQEAIPALPGREARSTLPWRPQAAIGTRGANDGTDGPQRRLVARLRLGSTH